VTPGGQDDRLVPAGRRMFWRALGGAVLIFVLTATATATAALLFIEDIIPPEVHKQPQIKTDQITRAEAGKPQTLLLLGSDRRYADLKKNNPLLKKNMPARSDTMMLVRIDPDKGATAILSIPRDLHVKIPGIGVDKINRAYEEGGEDLTLRTVKKLLGIKINHAINVNFSGFREVVNAIGCVYADIDRRYYHSNAGLPAAQQYAEIDVPAGYQRLCGQRALDYVRFRHGDNDFVRAARQQDFLRAAKDQVSTSSLFKQRRKLVKIFVDSTDTDADLTTSSGIRKLLFLGLFSAGNPVQKIPLPAQEAGDETNAYVVATDAALRRAARLFMDAGGPARNAARKKRSTGRKATVPTANLANVRRAGARQAATIASGGRLPFPVYFPAKATQQARPAVEDARPKPYTLRDRADRRHRAYRLVMVESSVDGQYYGVQGTDWRKPPLLANPTSTRVVQGRRLELFRDGNRLRFVAWRTPRAAYWVSNSLSLALSNAEMIGIARSLTRAAPRR
jgi:LCP family protein required for cell wall assembly